jgi:hypothetical protein
MTARPRPTLCFIDTETTGLDPERHEIWEVAVSIREPSDGGGWGEDAEYVWQLPVDLARADTIALNIGHFPERRWPIIRPGPMAEQGTALQEARAGTLTTDGLRLREDDMLDWAEMFARLTWGAHLIGCVPSFDENRLERLLRRLGACPGWHYQPIDVETMAAGYVIGYAKGIARAALSGVQARTLAEAGGGTVPSIGQFGGALQRQDAARLPIDSEEISKALGVQPDQFERHSALGDVLWARAIWDRIHQIGDPA